MLPEDKFFQTHDKSKIWQRYCGFLDLSIEEFMEIQERLLLEQIELVADSPLGKIIMKGQKPASVEEFRRMVPLTTYEDYEPYIGECQEDHLALKPICWMHTSGTGGSFKWAPYTERCMESWARKGIAMLILASAGKRGEINIYPGVRLFHNLPPRPYGSALGWHHTAQHFSIKGMPPIEELDSLEFEEKIQKDSVWHCEMA